MKLDRGSYERSHILRYRVPGRLRNGVLGRLRYFLTFLCSVSADNSTNVARVSLAAMVGKRAPFDHHRSTEPGNQSTMTYRKYCDR